MPAHNPVEQLTEPQRECLRLVLAHYSSKEIAQRLGIGPSAVDKRIERAVQLLGASSRFDAARRLAEADGRAGALTPGPVDSEPVLSEPTASDLTPSDPMDVATPTGDGEGGPWLPGDHASLTPSVDSTMPATRAAILPRVLWTWQRRLLSILLLTFGLAAASLILLGMADQLTSILERFPAAQRSLRNP